MSNICPRKWAGGRGGLGLTAGHRWVSLLACTSAEGAAWCGRKKGAASRESCEMALALAGLSPTATAGSALAQRGLAWSWEGSPARNGTNRSSGVSSRISKLPFSQPAFDKGVISTTLRGHKKAEEQEADASPASLVCLGALRLLRGPFCIERCSQRTAVKTLSKGWALFFLLLFQV